MRVIILIQNLNKTGQNRSLVKDFKNAEALRPCQTQRSKPI